MARLRLSTDKAEKNGPLVSVILLSNPFPTRTVEITTAADAQREFDAYATEAAATGQPMCVFMLMHPHDRAPRGFKKLPFKRFVNLD